MSRKPKVLVVDDTSDVRQIIRTALSTLDYDVLEAKNGQEAVEIARRQKPDLIFMDCVMPVLDGLQACRLLRGLAETAQTPIIMCTSQDSVSDIEKSLQAGATDYLPKPIDLDRLLRCATRAREGFRLEK